MALQYLNILIFSWFMIILSVANLHQTQKVPNYFSTAKLPTTWTIKQNTFGEDQYCDQIILSSRKPNSSYGIGFGCGFYSNIHSIGLFHFTAGIFETGIDGSGKQVWHFKERIWLANRNRSVGNNATLQFKEDGNLELRDFDGSYVWSMNTSGKENIIAMKLMETGNLILYNKANIPIWESFDHPTDSLMMGKKLVEGQTLVSSVWQHNMSEGNYRLSVTSQGMFAYYKAHDVFKQVLTYKASVESSLVLAYNASVRNLTMHFGALPKPYLFFGSPTNYSMMSHMKLDHDGHLRIYGDDSESYSIPPTLLKDCYNGVCSDDGSHMLDECSYPTSCGGYGVSSNDGSCSCLPRFVDADKMLGVLGC
ncbi:S-locus lectin protein kinase family protein [Euphorbia peplus]|nr:S-locus lectin protein kinase family protein [Euphorbia peplus]